MTEPYVVRYFKENRCQVCNSVTTEKLPGVIEFDELRGLISTALDNDHCGCTDNSCDIDAAWRNDFLFSAAHLISGATDCPSLDPLMPLVPYEDGWPIDWDEWTKFFKENTIECEGCNAFNFTDLYTPETCDNCGVSLPPVEADDEN